jgi:hypothetical protein
MWRKQELMGVPKPADDITTTDTVTMEHPRRQNVPDPSRPEEDPTVIQPVLRPTPAAPGED